MSLFRQNHFPHFAIFQFKFFVHGVSSYIEYILSLVLHLIYILFHYSVSSILTILLRMYIQGMPLKKFIYAFSIKAVYTERVNLLLVAGNNKFYLHFFFNFLFILYASFQVAYFMYLF